MSATMMPVLYGNGERGSVPCLNIADRDQPCPVCAGWDFGPVNLAWPTEQQLKSGPVPGELIGVCCECGLVVGDAVEFDAPEKKRSNAAA